MAVIYYFPIIPFCFLVTTLVLIRRCLRRKLIPPSSAAVIDLRRSHSFTLLLPPPSPPFPRYDVFLSFRGEDTRFNFTSYLFAALKRQGFYVFHDSMLRRGEEISPKLLKAIEQSRVSIVVFSKRYADSRWCLDELVKIVYCREWFGHKIIPVFLDVEPSDVRKQEGCYASAFRWHTWKFDKARVRMWREALAKTGNLAGFHLRNDANRDEEKFVCQIVEQVAVTLDRPDLHVASHPVGLEARVQEVISLLNLGSDGVRIVVIWGIGGLGKTTIAKATYNRIAHRFQGSSFLSDVGESARQVNGLVDLQNRLLSDIINDSDRCVKNYHKGIEEIKRAIGHQRVLLILDDVSHVKQLEMLAINRSFFRPGSRIIITTRNQFCIDRRQVDTMYEPPELDAWESLKLFNWYAFGEENPIQDGYENLVEEIAKLTGGVPLVVEVWGSYFRSFEIELWETVLRRLRKIPHDDIQTKLRISFDALGKEEKKLFLDAACFFTAMNKKYYFGGTNKDFLVKVLEDEDSGCFPEIDMKILAYRFLIRVDTQGRLTIHDMVRAMGREVVREESLEDPGKRSRLWDHNDIRRVLTDSSATESVESVILRSDLVLKDVQVNFEAIKKLRNLRLLYFENVHLYGTSDGVICFPRLRYLWWSGFPFAYIPYNLDMRNVVAITLQYSKLEQIWKGTKRLDKLRFLDVSYSRFLIKTPDFSGMRNLEELIFHECIRLEEVHDSIGCLQKLVVLDLNSCRGLRKVPIESISQLKSLRKLDLSGCSRYFQYKRSIQAMKSSAARFSCISELILSECNLSHVPEEIGGLTSLKKLNLEENKFSSLPGSLVNLNQLEDLFVSHCVNLQTIPSLPSNILSITAWRCKRLKNLPDNLSELTSVTSINFSLCPKLGFDPLCLNRFIGLSKLETLQMGGCNLSLVPAEIGSLASLKRVHLWRNKFSSLPDNLGNLRYLEYLNFSNCVRLKSVPHLPPSLTDIVATGCVALETIPITLQKTDWLEMNLSHCPKLIDSENANSYIHTLRRTILRSYQAHGDIPSFGIKLSGREIPSWCDYQASEGECIQIMAPRHVNKKIEGWIFCGIFSNHGEVEDFEYDIEVKVVNTSKNKSHTFVLMYGIDNETPMCVTCEPLSKHEIVVDGGDELLVQFKPRDTLKVYTSEQVPNVNRFGICLICKGDEMNSCL